MCNRNISPHAHGNGEEDGRSPSTYLEQTVFGLLLPALKETFATASEWNALRVQKCRFNGLDFIAEILWNHNPRRSKRYSPRLNVFEIPEFQQWLRECPRPFYPKSWLWSEDEAALHLQRYVRGWLVRKRADVQEMREFWKKWAASDAGQQKTSRLVRNYAKHGIMGTKVDGCKKYRTMFYAPCEAAEPAVRDTF
ncbi:IQ domain-containing protein K isoform X2 [Andrena cerasifolii]|uniref:IQ domain-containing protein K isoform X2 n=1 Tax=Andrena cerasifolii TaxID=2819439 RepID=UPI004037ABAE